MFRNILEGIEVKLNVDYFSEKNSFDSIAEKIVYTGKIDEYFNYDLGILEYRTIKFDHKVMKGDYQGNAAINHTGDEVKYTRSIEHKHFEFKKSEDTVVTFEYPEKWDQSKIPLYPVNDEKNNKICFR